MIKLSRKIKDPLIFLGLLIAVPCFIYYISMNFGDQRVHIEKKQWQPAEAADQGVDPNRLKSGVGYIETRLPMARGMVIIKNGRTIHEQYYWRGGPQEKDYLHSLNRPVLHALTGIAIEKQLLTGPTQPLADFFPDRFPPDWQELEGQPPTIADLLRIQTSLIWGEGGPDYWELFYSGDRIKAAIEALAPVNGKFNQAANFAANFLLAEIIQAVSSMSVFEFADRYLFTPMGITSQEETRKKGGLVDPFIGFKLRTLDLAKFGYLIMNEGLWQRSQVIPRAWIQGITEELHNGSGTGSWGGWHSVMIHGMESIMAKGEGGQYIVLLPGLDMLAAVSSKSLFPLSENSGYDHLFQLIYEAADEKLTGAETAADPDERPYYEPNFVYATEVPEDIRQFFHDLAKDIATNDINRILSHYAKGYENKDEDYSSMYGYWRKIFYGGTGELEFVQIEKMRIDNNRAYLRGNLKYSYANMNEGSIGWFPLENLIKLRGRWLWLGTPTYGAILDRDEYFDAEVSDELKGFIDECGSALIGTSRQNETVCFAGDFVHNGLRQEQIQALLQPFWGEGRNIKIHITKAIESEEEGLLEGYIEDSLIGNISLPPGMKIIKKDTRWKWTGNGIK